MINAEIISIPDLGLPDVVATLARHTRGLEHEAMLDFIKRCGSIPLTAYPELGEVTERADFSFATKRSNI